MKDRNKIKTIVLCFVLFLICFLPFKAYSDHKILFIGFVPKGGEEQIFCRCIPGCVMNGLYESWRKIINELKKDSITISFIENTNFCKHWKNKDTRWNKIKNEYDLFIFHDLPCFLNPLIFKKLGRKSIVILAEPPSVIPDQYNLKILNYFTSVFTWRDDWAGIHNMKKLNYPVFLPFKGGEPFSKRKLSCMMCGNKQSTTEGELYSTRKLIIDFFLTDSKSFSLYGPGWNLNQIPVYKGQVPYKYDVLKQHRFNFCLENIQGQQGYITEKIFDAFEAGCIPIYLGSSNISQYVPDNCYIGYSRFESFADLKKFMQEFTEEDYNAYLKNIQNYLKSELAQQFSEDIYVNTVTKEIRALLFKR